MSDSSDSDNFDSSVTEAESASVPSPPESSSKSPGKMLEAAREARELSIDEVGDALNLAPQSIEWLETDNFESLPAAAFTQGYIRNFAKYVGLDADEVVAAYQTKAGKPTVAWESPRGNAGFAELVQRHPGLLISLVVIAVVLLIVIVLAVVWPSEGEESGASATDAGAGLEIGMEVAPNSAPTSVSRPKQAPSVPEPPAETEREAAKKSTRFDDPGRANQALPDRDAIDPSDPLAHLPVAKTYPVKAAVDSSAKPQGTTENYKRSISRRLTPNGSSVVRFEVVEDCWISVKSVAEEELFNMLARSGQTIKLTGEGPFRVLLGYAPGASLYFDDRQILLAPYTRNNIASLVIGQ